MEKQTNWKRKENTQLKRQKPTPTQHSHGSPLYCTPPALKNGYEVKDDDESLG